MGRRSVTTYYCDWCKVEGADPRVIDNTLVINAHGRAGSRKEWSLCDSCEKKARLTLQELIDHVSSTRH